MRIISLRPEYTEHKIGRTHRAGAWRALDSRETWETESPILYRDVYHYATRMVQFVSRDNGASWTADHVKIGHGSVSDQSGVNQLTSVRYIWERRELTRDYGWRYSRRGGASLEFVGPESSVSVAPVIEHWPTITV